MLPFLYSQRSLSSFIDLLSTFFFIMSRKKLIEKKKRNRKNEIIQARRVAAQTVYVINFSNIFIASQTSSVKPDLDIVVEAIVTMITSHSSRYNSPVISQFHFRPSTSSFSLFSLKSAAANLIDQKENLTNVRQDEKKNRICLSPQDSWFVFTD